MSQKRKRSPSVFSSTGRSSQARHLPSDSINPLSHSEGTIKQLRVAGLTEDDLLPSSYIADFPHRPARAPPQDDEEDGEGSQQWSDEEGHDDDERGDGGEQGGTKKEARRRQGAARRMRGAQDRHLGFLTGVVLRAVEEGDMARAKRAFGLLRRSEVAGKPVDLRRNGLWSLGAEVLMRDGEEIRAGSVVVGQGGGFDGDGGDQEGQGDDDTRHAAGGRTRTRRWGSAANMPQLRAYLESLIRQHPYNRLHPDSTSDLDFYPVLLGCEFYNTWVEHKLALERLSGGSGSWSDDDDLDVPAIDMPEYGDDVRAGGDDHQRQDFTGRERRLRQEKAGLGLRAMAAMRDVAARMDALMENAPYSRSVEFLRLRGMVALYIGDLSVPPAPRVRDEEEEGSRVREQERMKARGFFVRIRQNGGHGDAYTDRLLGERNAGQDDDYGEDEDDDDHDMQWSGLPVFSSMPTR